MIYAIRDKKNQEFFEGIDRGFVWTSPRLSDAKLFRIRKDATDIIGLLKKNRCTIDFEVVKVWGDPLHVYEDSSCT